MWTVHRQPPLRSSIIKDIHRRIEMDMMIEGLVSVITPMYNAEKYIGETIESVIAQTYTNWEMLIVDDCSGDSCADIVKQYCEKDNRVHYYSSESNSGVAMTRNRAISCAKGQYIAFLDSDDIWQPYKLEKQICMMKNNQVAFCFSGCEIIDIKGERLEKIRRVPLHVSYKDLLKGNVIPCLTVVLDRKEITDISFPDIGNEDYALWLSILQKGIQASGLDEPLAYYRVDKHSLSGNKMKSAKWTWNVYRKYLRLGLFKSIMCFCCYTVNGLRK